MVVSGHCESGTEECIVKDRSLPDQTKMQKGRCGISIRVPTRTSSKATGQIYDEDCHPLVASFSIMKKSLDQALCKKYPEIFADRFGNAKTTAMCWGFEHGDGWAKIIDELCAKIMEVCGDHIPVATQVKEKYGTLRFYIDWGNEAVFDAISEAEDQSAKTCEVCGKSGKLRGKDWVRTLCDKDNGSFLK